MNWFTQAHIFFARPGHVVAVKKSITAVEFIATTALQMGRAWMVEMYEDAFAILGLLGVAFYLGAYAALQFGFVRGSSYVYTLLNLCGATLVLVSLAVEFNLASALIQVSWIAISVVGLSRLYLRNRALQFTEEEAEFISERFPTLPRLSAKEFLNSGGWVDLPQGEEVLREGAPVGHLFYLSDGAVSVSSDGHEITRLTKGFLGEINVIDGAPASATVKALQPSRAFVIARDELRGLTAKDNEFKSALETSLSREMGQRLMRANRQIIGAGQSELT